MVGADEKEQPEHPSGGRLEGRPGDADAGDVGQGERLAQGSFGVPVHVGVKDVVEGTVLEAEAGDEQNGQGELNGRGPVPERISEESTGHEEDEGPGADPVGLLERVAANHGTKERPTPEKGVGPISLLDVGGISCCCPSRPERR